jgi:predicted house-cleaning noncanonical NTP pyrophosphatase (MazG superfamily)
MGISNLNQNKQHARRGNPIKPLRPITIITENGTTELPIRDISPEAVGWKAFGLASLPTDWTPDFFVISKKCFIRNHEKNLLESWISQCLNKFGFNNSPVIVRSSGKNETMESRGQLVSQQCSQNEILATIEELKKKVPRDADDIHWVIQKYIESKIKGNFSNERRLNERKRDFVVEFESQVNRPGYAVPIHVRQWRDGNVVNLSRMNCTSEMQITLKLKNVGIWANQFFNRTHFEWVWDGKSIYVVQLEDATRAKGIDPPSLIPSQIISISPSDLQVFRIAQSGDFDRYEKLKNARLYESLGYQMPAFYVIDDSQIINDLLSGVISPNLKSDLQKLTQRPLIIRTNADNKEMLPRSDELRSYQDAEKWLLQSFAPKIIQANLSNVQMCLIAHHFVPSIASAWARAEPTNKIVRIESLWGIPEGLYWYSHDTFEVNTNDIKIEKNKSVAFSQYRLSEHRRFKGTFIAPNEDGQWITFQTSEKYDWARSVRYEKWLFEIAQTTKLIAQEESYPVSVMWFIDNHPKASKHKVLPWFHSRSEIGNPVAAPRNKLKTASDFEIKDSRDWEKLQDFISKGNKIERVVVKPTDEKLIRNHDFAEKLGKLAVEKNFVIEMSGGILSHAYYMLQKAGATVECIDLFGTEEDILEFNKIVRDKIPEIIISRGERAETIRLEGDALVKSLQRKLIEEALEVLDAKSGPDIISEIADVEEVIRSICKSLNIEKKEVEEEREKKEKKRGGFNEGLMLIKTSAPHSITSESRTSDLPLFAGDSATLSEKVITEINDLPQKDIYRQMDDRKVDEKPEKIFRLETEIPANKEVEKSFEFTLPIGDEQQDSILKLEIKRSGSSIRATVRLRVLNAIQPQLEFPESE